MKHPTDNNLDEFMDSVKRVAKSRSGRVGMAVAGAALAGVAHGLARRKKEQAKKEKAQLRQLKIKKLKKELGDSLDVNSAITKLLAGSTAKDVVEDIYGTAALYAAALMHYNGESREAAMEKAAQMVGSTPDEEFLHTLTVNSGIPKTEPVSYHLIKAGHFSPERRVMPQSPVTALKRL